MARIAGINLPTNKRVVIALTYIHGIGKVTSKNICESAGVNISTRVNELSEQEVSSIRQHIDTSCSESSLTRVEMFTPADSHMFLDVTLPMPCM